MTDEQTAGTPAPDDTDAPSTETGGTPETDDRDAASTDSTPAEPAHHLAWKESHEQLKQLREKYGEDLDARLEQPPAPSPAVPSDRQPAPEDPRRARIREWAEKGDPVAAAQLESLEFMDEMRAEAQVQRDAIFLNGLPMEERKQVYQEYVRNPRAYRNAADAAQAVEQRRIAAENAKLRQEVETLKKSVARDPNVVRTDQREHTAKQTQARKMTGAQYDRLVEDTRRERGDNAARALQRQYAAGEIDVTD